MPLFAASQATEELVLVDDHVSMTEIHEMSVLQHKEVDGGACVVSVMDPVVRHQLCCRTEQCGSVPVSLAHPRPQWLTRRSSDRDASCLRTRPCRPVCTSSPTQGGITTQLPGTTAFSAELIGGPFGRYRCGWKDPAGTIGSSACLLKR